MARSRSGARSASKTNAKFFIALIAIIVVIAIVAFFVLRFGFPDVYADILQTITGEGEHHNSSKPSTLVPLVMGEGTLYVHFVDVGQGDCIYIQFPDGKDMVIDCGNEDRSSSVQKTALAYIKNYNPDGQIDFLMLTHSDADHVSYLDEIIDAFVVKNIYMPNILPSHKNFDDACKASLDAQKLALFTDEDTISTLAYYQFFYAALTEEDCNIFITMDEDENSNSIVIADENATYRLTFYCQTQQDYKNNNLNSAEKKNAISPVGILEYNERRIVFTGDSNESESSEPAYAKRIGNIDCDVLKVAHHGSRTSSIDAFLDAVTCEYAVICCGEGNKYGHPTAAALGRFVERNMTIYRTDNDGNIVLQVDSSGSLTFKFADGVEPSQDKNCQPAQSTKAA